MAAWSTTRAHCRRGTEVRGERRMNTLRLALRMLRRDWRAGELRVLIAALVLAVASVGTVGFFTDRVKGALTRQANLLLGGDLLLSGDRPLPDSYADEARRRGLGGRAGDQVQQHDSVRSRGCDRQRVRGVDRCSAGRRQGSRVGLSACAARSRSSIPRCRRERRPRGIPAPGEAWIDGRLAARLNVGKGSKLAVGDTTLTVGAIVLQEPEVAGGLLSTGSEAAHESRRRPGDKIAATRQSRIVSAARRRTGDRRLPRLGQGRVSSAVNAWNRFAICAPKCVRRSIVPNNSSRSRHWSP